MQALAERTAPVKGDLAAIKQWAAEDYAISIGLLRECPYHGEPYQPRVPVRLRREHARVESDDSIFRVFHGDMHALLVAANGVARRYGERCSQCAASEHDEFD